MVGSKSKAIEEMSFSFTIEVGPDQPGEGRLSPSHQLSASAIGLSVGQSFTLFGRIWKLNYLDNSRD